MRLSVFLAKCGVASRRGAEKLIAEGLVSVNGQTIDTQGSTVDPSKDRVLLRGREVSQEKKVIYLYHKPAGVITTLDDPFGRPDVSGFLSGIEERVFPVGRLDRDVTGLLIFTNDGDYAQRLLHPSFEIKRTYIARVKGKPSKQALSALLEGVSLEDGVGVFTDVKRLAPAELEVQTTEGRKHFVKKMLAAVGHPVEKLVRIAFGPYRLDNLQEGAVVKVKFQKLD